MNPKLLIALFAAVAACVFVADQNSRTPSDTQTVTLRTPLAVADGETRATMSRRVRSGIPIRDITPRNKWWLASGALNPLFA